MKWNFFFGLLLFTLALGACGRGAEETPVTPTPESRISAPSAAARPTAVTAATPAPEPLAIAQIRIAEGLLINTPSGQVGERTFDSLPQAVFQDIRVVTGVARVDPYLLLKAEPHDVVGADVDALLRKITLGGLQSQPS